MSLAWSQLAVQGGLRKDVLAPGGWGLGAVKAGSPLKSCVALEEFVLASSPSSALGRKEKVSLHFGSSSSNIELPIQLAPPNTNTNTYNPALPTATTKTTYAVHCTLRLVSFPSIRSIGFRSGTPVRWVDPRQPASKKLRQKEAVHHRIRQPNLISPTVNGQLADDNPQTLPNSNIYPPSNLEPPTPRASRPCSTRFPDRARRLPDHPATKRDCRAQRPRRRPA